MRGGKLMWALAHAETSADVRRIMLTNYCGEISLPHGKQAIHG
ncbi:MAG: hypothetical protein R2912_13185 [Eubacteriales bacterium]